MNWKPKPDAIVRFTLTAESSAGGPRTVSSGYHPHYDVREDYWTSVQHQFLDVDHVTTGGTAMAHVVFIMPEAYPHSLWPGRKLNVREGDRIVGEAMIIEVFNPVLLAGPRTVSTEIQSLESGADSKLIR